MALKNACFVSHCHDDGELMKQFMEQFEKTLKAYLGPFTELPICTDAKRLLPGYKFNEALAEAICQSICMIVVYVPRYEESDYCLREFAAMEELTQQRIAALGETLDPQDGFIIPIILRGDTDDLPPRIKDSIHFSDFTKFTTASDNLLQDKQAVAEIEKIAKVIYGLRKKLQGYAHSDCKKFSIPSKPPGDWRQAPEPSFPRA